MTIGIVWILWYMYWRQKIVKKDKKIQIVNKNMSSIPNDQNSSARKKYKFIELGMKIIKNI